MVETFTDVNANGIYDSPEDNPHSLQSVCNGEPGPQGEPGFSSLLKSTAIPPGDPRCPAGGYHVTAFLDKDRNMQPSPGEILYEQDICNGLRGEKGDKGANAVITVQPAPPGACPNGGKLYMSWTDVVQTPGETVPGFSGAPDYNLQESIICNGKDGANGKSVLVEVTNLPSGTGSLCVNGGSHVVFWYDLNGNGIRDPGEAVEDYVSCNGKDGDSVVFQSTPIPSGSPICPTGGVTYTQWMASTPNLKSSQNICNGLNGIITTTSNPPQCPDGGVLFTTCTDLNNDVQCNTGSDINIIQTPICNQCATTPGTVAPVCQGAGLLNLIPTAAGDWHSATAACRLVNSRTPFPVSSPLQNSGKTGTEVCSIGNAGSCLGVVDLRVAGVNFNKNNLNDNPPPAQLTCDKALSHQWPWALHTVTTTDELVYGEANTYVVCCSQASSAPPAP